MEFLSRAGYYLVKALAVTSAIEGLVGTKPSVNYCSDGSGAPNTLGSSAVDADAALIHALGIKVCSERRGIGSFVSAEPSKRKKNKKKKKTTADSLKLSRQHSARLVVESPYSSRGTVTGHSLRVTGNVKQLHDAKLIFVTDMHNVLSTRIAQKLTTQRILMTSPKVSLLLRKEGFESAKKVPQYKEIGTDRVYGLESQGRDKLQVLLTQSNALDQRVAQTETFEEIREEMERNHRAIITDRNRGISVCLQEDIKQGNVVIVHVGDDHLRFPGKELESLLRKQPHVVYRPKGFARCTEKQFLEAKYLTLRARSLSQTGNLRASLRAVQDAVRLDPSIDIKMNELELLKILDPMQMYTKMAKLRKETDQFYNLEMFYLKQLVDLEARVFTLVNKALKSQPGQQAQSLKDIQAFQKYSVPKSEVKKLFNRMKRLIPVDQSSELALVKQDISKKWAKRASEIQKGIEELQSQQQKEHESTC